MRCTTEGTNNIKDVVASLHLTEASSGNTDSLYNEGDGAALHIGVGYGERDAFALFIKAKYDEMTSFAAYAFNKSHAAAYSVLAYRTGFLKANYPAEFMAANLTNEITSTDGLPGYIAEARKMGIPVDAPDVNRSDVTFDVVDGRIVFGLKGIKGMGEGAARSIVNERNENGPYKSFIDFVKRACTRVEKDEEGHERVAVNKKAVEVLIKTGGFEYAMMYAGGALVILTVLGLGIIAIKKYVL